MNLDELQATWQDYGRRLDSLVQLNHEILNAGTLDRARSSLQRQRRWAILGIVTNAVVVPFVGLFIASSQATLKYLLPAMTIDLYFIANLIVHARQAHLLAGVDFRGQVTAIQRRIDEIVRLRIRFAQWLAMTVVLMWVPISIVLGKAILGLDLYSLAPRWLIANGVAGLCCIPVVLWLARRVARGTMVRPSQLLLREIAGENLTQAKRFLDDLSELEREGARAD